MTTPNLSRYTRQIIFPGLGEAGQRKLLDSTVVLLGCGATGTVIANHLVRSGVGHLRLIDRDFIELNNLQRQGLFDEQDIADGLPKAEAARRKLSRINSEITVEGLVADVTPDNILDLLAGADLAMDGADNFETRFLLNDACVKLGLPWVYTGVIASYGMTMTIRPGETACLRCLLGQMPAPGTAPTCDTAGVLAPSVAVVASIAAGEALKLLAGFGELNAGMLLNYDLLDNSLDRFEVLRRPDCPTCGQHDFEFLYAETGTRSATLCGRNAVQISVVGRPAVDLAALAERLRAAGESRVTVNSYLLRAALGGMDVTVFPDGRAIIKGTEDESVARTIYAKYVGM
ncbi:MAG TPA: ThiF family adenylyltransferase [Anaerolineae bacterium]|nr:ThiF family adenylyltransferase [Anaerolineae bacterium]